MKKMIITSLALTVGVSILLAQKIEISANTLQPAFASLKMVKLNNEDVVQVVMDSAVKLFDEPTFVKLKEYDFSNGTIEVEVKSKFLPNAPDWARGFIGLAFRINNDNSQFEGIYLRPDNGRVDDQIRRNHSIQYFSFPKYKFSDLRKVEPEKYESYTDMQMNDWIKMKIVVKGAEARLFIDENSQPSLVVVDMKHGADGSGSVGLWVGPGTEGYFKNLRITK